MFNTNKTEVSEDNIRINHKNLKLYSNIIKSKKYQHILFPSIKIALLKNSFLKICSLGQLYPEESTRFTYYEDKNKIYDNFNIHETSIQLSDSSVSVETTPLRNNNRKKLESLSSQMIDLIMFQTSKKRFLLEKIYKIIYKLFILFAIIRMLSLYHIYVGYDEVDLTPYKILSLVLMFLLVLIGVYGLCQMRYWYIFHLKLISFIMILTLIETVITCHIPNFNEFDGRIVDRYIISHFILLYSIVLLLIVGLVINYIIYSEFKKFMNEVLNVRTKLIID
jgi:hypothetical protein